MLGLGRTAGLLTRGLGPLGAIADVAEELFFLPQNFGKAESGALASSKPYRDLTYGTYALGRAGGFSGKSLMDSIYTGNRPPAWMEQYGLGSDEALSMISNFGIVQKGSEQSVDLAKSIASARLNPSFSGLNVDGSFANAAQYGLISGNGAGVRDFMQQIGPIMTSAVEQGANRASVLRSIDMGVSMAVRGGGGIGATPGGIGSFLMQYSSLPGGKTGEAGLDVAQRLQSATATVGENPIRTMAFMDAAQNIKTPAQMKAFLDKSQPGYYEKFVANPVGKQLMDDYFKSRASGNMPFAGMGLAQIVSGGGVDGISGNPEAERDLLANNRYINALPGYAKPFAKGIHNLTPAQYDAGKIAENGGNLTSYADIEKFNGLPPGLLSAIRRSEGSGPNSVSPKGAQGIFQIMPGTQKDLGITDPTDEGQEARGAGLYLKQLTAMFGGDTQKAIAAYNWGLGKVQKDVAAHGDKWRDYLPDETKKYLANTLNSMGDDGGGDALGAGPRPGSNVPVDALKAEADVKAGAMGGSETSFDEMNKIIPVVNKSLNDFGKAVDRATVSINKLMAVPAVNGGVNPFYTAPP
jgi:soluble lytic murein transglycosylase-like protein